MTWSRRLLLALLVALVAGCASGAASPPPRDSHAPRTRCMADPHETGARPFFFLFCIESP